MEFHSILVPVMGTEADDEAMKLACQLIDKKGNGKICAVCIITVTRALPLDTEIEPEIAKAEGILDHVENIAKEQGYMIDTELLQAREAAPAIVEAATQREIDLILMGFKYQKRLGEFSLGDVVPYVLKNARCRVILYHQYTDEDTA